MSDARLKQFAPLGVAVGLGGLIVAAFIYLYQRQFDVAVQSSLAIAALGFALAMLLNPGAMQTWLAGRQARYGSNVLVMTLAFAGIVVLANYLVYKNNKQWDFTENQANTLSPETVEAVKQLPQPVTAIGFYSTNFVSSQEQTRKLLDRYRIASGDKFSYEFHDIYGEPALANQYGITRDGTLVLVMGDQKEEITFAGEQEITSALVRFSHPAKRVVYFLTRHGELDATDTGESGLSGVVDLLKKQNYDIQPLNLQVSATVPSDARALVIAGPQVPVTSDEVAIIGGYLEATPNSALIVMLDPPVEMQAEPGTAEPLAEYLSATWGLQVSSDVIIDPFFSVRGQPLIPASSAYGDSPITQKLQRVPTVFPAARSVLVSGTPETLPDVTYSPLVITSEGSWGETNIESLTTGPALDEGDSKGPLNIAVAAENKAAKSRLVVFGDAGFASNRFANANEVLNAELFVNSVNWATADESLINLTPKIPTTRIVTRFDALTDNLILLVVVIIVPLVVVVLGGVVWFIRRRHV